MPRLIFVNRFFHPDHSATSQMLSDLAFALAADGRTVHVLTSRLRYEGGGERLPARETVRGVAIHRIPTTGFGRGRLLGRAVDYATFQLSAACALAGLARRGDIVVAMTDPPMVSVVTAPVAGLRGAKQVNWLQDVFPEVALELGAGSGRAARGALGAARRLRDRALRRAHANVVLGERMAGHVRDLGVAEARVRLIHNWADGTLLRPVPHADNPLRAAWGLGDAFVVAYSGNLGRAHDEATLLAAIAETEAAAPAAGGPRIVWLLIGGGARYEALRREAARRGLASVRFEPYQPREALSHSLSAADVHLVSLRPGLEGLVVPSKVYGIAAVGRPAIFVGDADGEVARLLAAHGSGLSVREGDGAQLAATVRALAADPALCRRLGESARRSFETHYDLAEALRQWRALLAEVEARP